MLEVGSRLSAAYAGLIAAGLGADVVAHRKSSTADGGGLERVVAAHFDRGKRLVASDVDAAGMAHLADVVITDLTPSRLRALGLPTDEVGVQDLRPGLVHVAITSMGLSGSHSEYEMDDITDWAAGGFGTMTRSHSRQRAQGHAPILPPGHQPELLAGIAAIVGLFAGSREAAATGRSVLVDVARFEVQASMSHHLFPAWLWEGVRHGSDGNPLAGIGHYLRAADRAVYVRPVEERQWLALADLLGVPDDVATERVDGMLLVHRDPTRVRELIAPRIREHTVDWLLTQGQARGIPIAEPASPTTVLNSPQLAARQAWRCVDLDGASVRVPAVPLLEPSTRAPARQIRKSNLLEEWS